MWLYIIDIISLIHTQYSGMCGFDSMVPLPTPSLYMILNTRLWMLQHLLSMVVCEIAYLGVLSSEVFWTSKMNSGSFQVNSGLLSQWNPSLARTWFFLHQSRRGQRMHSQDWARSNSTFSIQNVSGHGAPWYNDALSFFLQVSYWVQIFKILLKLVSQMLCRSVA